MKTPVSELKDKIRLICSDIDGTLISRQQEVPPINLRALSRFIDNGGKFAIVTGRFKTGALGIANKLGLKVSDIAGVYDNGAYVEADGHSIGAYGVPHEALLEIAERAHSYSARPVMFSGETWAVEEVDKWWKDINGFYEGRGVVAPFTEIIEQSKKDNYEEPVKLVLRLDEHEKMQMLKEDLSISYPSLLFFLSHPDILEVSLKQVDKGTGIEALASYYGLKLENIMAFGDFDNDVPMLKKAGFGVAMQNGTPDALSSANYITDTNENGGVGKAIEKFLL